MSFFEICSSLTTTSNGKSHQAYSNFKDTDTNTKKIDENARFDNPMTTGNRYFKDKPKKNSNGLTNQNLYFHSQYFLFFPCLHFLGQPKTDIPMIKRKVFLFSRKVFSPKNFQKQIFLNVIDLPDICGIGQCGTRFSMKVLGKKNHHLISRE